MSQTRRLVAILATDVAGYSRLIGADEEGTLNRLRSIRAELIDPKITEHRGRIVKTTGDGLLVEFTSVVDALRCVVQPSGRREWVERNADVPPISRIGFRYGVHQDDIVLSSCRNHLKRFSPTVVLQPAQMGRLVARLLCQGCVNRSFKLLQQSQGFRVGKR